MTVYVDELQEYPESMIKPEARRYGNLWCHLTADSTRELLDMARKLKLSPNHIQRSSSGIMHFDLVPSKRAMAIKLGATDIKAAEMARKEKIKMWYVFQNGMEPEADFVTNNLQDAKDFVERRIFESNVIVMTTWEPVQLEYGGKQWEGFRQKTWEDLNESLEGSYLIVRYAK